MFIGACARRVPRLGGLQRLMLGLEILHRAMLRRCIGLCVLFLLQLDACLLRLAARLLPAADSVIELTAPCLGASMAAGVPRQRPHPASLRRVRPEGRSGWPRPRPWLRDAGGGGCVLPCLGGASSNCFSASSLQVPCDGLAPALAPSMAS